MYEQLKDPAPQPQYQMFLGLRDGAKTRSLEVAVMLDDKVAHDPASPHMVMTNWLRRNWDKLCAAAELDHILNSAMATVGAVEAGTYKIKVKKSDGPAPTSVEIEQ